MKSSTTKPTASVHYTPILIVTALILSIPVIGMSVSDEWDWGAMDFVVMGSFIFITGLAIDWFVRKTPLKYRIPGIIGVVIAFVLIWAELATGAVERLFYTFD